MKSNTLSLTRDHLAFLCRAWIAVIVFAGCMFIAFGDPQSAHADHNSINCGNNTITFSDGTTFTGSSYSQGTYYGQSTYYTQATYYRQATYYNQSTYYAQSAYITGVDINVQPPIVKKGEDVEISWNPGNATSCTLAGRNFTQTSPSGGTVVGVTGESTYTLTCTHFEHTFTQSVTVKVVPQIEET